jgi:hypothetical protein
MQTQYTNTFKRGLIGDAATMRPYIKRARTYAKRKQITTIGVGGATDGTYTVRILSRAPNRPIDNVDSSFVAASSTADLIGAGLVTQINSKTELRNLLRASYNASTDQIVLTAVRTGEVFEVSFPSNPSTNLTQTATQSAVVTSLPLGVGMVSTDGDTAVRPSSTSDVLFGVVARGRGIEAPDDGSAEYHSAGDNLDLVTEGDWYVESEEDVTSEANPVYMRVNASGTEKAGAFRISPDGTPQVHTLTPGAGQNSVEVSVLVTITSGPHTGKSIELSALADGTMTATEVCDAWRTQLNADAFWSTLLVDSGTATLVLTAADAGFTFDVTNVQGTVTITATTPAVVDCVLVPSSKAKWLRPASGNTSAARCAALQLFGG